MIKIAFCTELFTPETGGVEKHSYELVKRLAKDDRFSVEVFTTECNTKVENAIIHMLTPCTVTQAPKRDLFLSYKFCKKLEKTLKQRKDLNIIFANGHMVMLPCYKAAKSLKIPIIAEIHDIYGKDWKLMAKGISRYIGKYLENKALKKKYDTIFTVNTALVQTLRLEFGQNAFLLQNGIDLSYIKSIEAPERDKNTVLFVGRLAPQKNFVFLLKTFEEICKNNKEITLKVVGDGILRKEYEEYCQKSDFLKNRVIFLGNVGLNGYENIIKEMKTAGMIVFPSERESFGIAIIEAMACGTPVISTMCDGPIDLIIPGLNGILVNKNNDFELLRAICLMNLDDDMRISIGKMGLMSAEAYDWDNIYKNFTEMILKSTNFINK